MSSLKTITLHSHASGPNPWKVAYILEELGLPYDSIMEDMSKLKQAPYTDINPNGRVPAIKDPNTGISLWESGAIIQYLIDTYDKDHKISHGTSPEKYYENQWLAFQISGQGPYYGQAAWFKMFHHEKLPSAVERYIKEVERVMAVLDTHLSKNEWLVGNKCTYADLAFIPWGSRAGWLMGEDAPKDKYKAYDAWMAKMQSRPAIKKVNEDAAKASGKH